MSTPSDKALAQQTKSIRYQWETLQKEAREVAKATGPVGDEWRRRRGRA